jgi:hypothetical protein
LTIHFLKPFADLCERHPRKFFQFGGRLAQLADSYKFCIERSVNAISRPQPFQQRERFEFGHHVRRFVRTKKQAFKLSFGLSKRLCVKAPPSRLHKPASPRADAADDRFLGPNSRL